MHTNNRSFTLQALLICLSLFTSIGPITAESMNGGRCRWGVKLTPNPACICRPEIEFKATSDAGPMNMGQWCFADPNAKSPNDNTSNENPQKHSYWNAAKYTEPDPAKWFGLPGRYFFNLVDQKCKRHGGDNLIWDYHTPGYQEAVVSQLTSLTAIDLQKANNAVVVTQNQNQYILIKEPDLIDNTPEAVNVDIDITAIPNILFARRAFHCYIESIDGSNGMYLGQFGDGPFRLTINPISAAYRTSRLYVGCRAPGDDIGTSIKTCRIHLEIIIVVLKLDVRTGPALENDIQKDEYIYIEGDSQMPLIRAKLLPEIPNGTLYWQFKVDYVRLKRDDHDCFPSAGYRMLNSNDVWDISGEMGQAVRGGEAEVLLLLQV
jgi:hypothetical protein